MNGFEPEEFQKKKRLLIISLIILLFIQGVVLWAYYFKEKQVTLALPMILGVFINVYAIINLFSLGK